MKQQEILEKIIPQLRKDTGVTAVMLTGSVAAGTEYASSDLNLFLLGNKNKINTELVEDILVEFNYITKEAAQIKLDECSMEVYRYLGSKIIYDLDGSLIKLMRIAISSYENYRVSERSKAELRHWLYSTKIKIEAAIQDNNDLKADFVTAISSSRIVEAVFAVNDIPMPPVSRVLQELSSLHQIPGYDWFHKLFGKDTIERAKTIMYTIDWIMMLL